LFDAKDDKLFDDAMTKVGLSQNAEKAVRQFALKGGMRSGITKMLRRSDGYINEKNQRNRQVSRPAPTCSRPCHARGGEEDRRTAARFHAMALLFEVRCAFSYKGVGVQLCVLWRLGRRDVRFSFFLLCLKGTTSQWNPRWYRKPEHY
jgi:hypothetical protein